MDTKDIIKARRTEMGLTMKELADKVGVSEGTVSRWESGNISNMRRDKIVLLSRVLEIPYEVIMGWKTDADKFGEFAQDFNRRNFPDSDLRPISVKKFPVLGQVACGEPRLITEEREVYVENTTEVHADAILIAKGDSMTGARIHDGDLVFIRFQPMVENGEIAAVRINDEATLKRFYRYADDLIVLRAENPEYPDQIYKGEELNDITIIGKAVAFQSDVK